MESRVLRTLAVGTLVALTALVGAPAQAAFPGQNGKIAFTSSSTSANTIATVDGDGTGYQTIVPIHPDRGGAFGPAWSPDGESLAFVRWGIEVVDHDGSDPRYVFGMGPSDHHSATWSPDGTKLAAVERSCSAGDCTMFVQIFPGGNTIAQWQEDAFAKPAWSPDGTRIAITREGQVWTMNANGSSFVPVPGAFGTSPNWSPDGSRIAFGSSCCVHFAHNDIYTVKPDGTALTRVTFGGGTGPAWSPDGIRIAFSSGRDGNGEIYTASATGGDEQRVTNTASSESSPDWQPIPINAYARPKGATPLRASLVRAFAECTAPNRTHGPPLAFGSCFRQTPSGTPAISPYVTVGTPDVNGVIANFVGLVRLDVAPGNPTTSNDEADVRVIFDASDLRCFHPTSSVPACGLQNNAAGRDYIGELQARLPLRITDKDNSGAGTVQDAAITFAVPCTNTVDAQIGGDCDVTSSMDSLVPGSVAEGRRAIWQMDQLQVFDGGPDADADTPDNSLFAVQGLFVP